MAFLPTPAPLARASKSAFTGVRTAAATSPRSASAAVPARRAPVRMATPATEEGKKESPEVGKAGDSMWKEDLFAGGFPGGEQFLKAWVEDGMTKEVPDMPSRMQPKADYMEKKVEKGGVLGKLDTTEFFKTFVGSDTDPAVAAEAEASSAAAATQAATKTGSSAGAASAAIPTATGPDEAGPATGLGDPEAPDDALYAPYFPRDKRYLAPEIKLEYNQSPYDSVSMAMTEVKASVGDLYFPKQEQNIAPIISLSYNGNPATAYVKVEMAEVEPLPTLPPPARPGQAVTSLVPTPSGGLKLQYEIEGEDGKVNI